MGSTHIQEVTEGQGVRRQRKSRNRRERERDTGKSAEKGVSRMEFDRKEVECCSDTGNFGEKSVSRMGFEGNEAGEEPGARTKEEEERKPPASIEGKLIVAGERFFANAQNDSLVGR